MSNIPNTLYALQTLELAVDKARQRIQQIESALENDENLKAAQLAFDACEVSIHQAQAILKDIELEIAGLLEKIKEVDELLYSGRIKNPKTLQERQDEMASLKKRQTGLEARLLEASEHIENQKRSRDEAEKNLAEAQKKRDKDQIDLVKELKLLNIKVKDQLRKRRDMMPTIPQEIYEQYKLLRKQKNGIAVGQLHEDSCTACHIEQTQDVIRQIKSGAGIVHCRNCGRILVLEN